MIQIKINKDSGRIINDILIFPKFLLKRNFQNKPHARNPTKNFYNSDGTFNKHHAYIKDGKYINTMNNYNTLSKRTPILKAGDKFSNNKQQLLRHQNIKYKVVRV